MKERKFFTVSQLVEYFGNGVISRGSIYLMIKRGEIPTVLVSAYLSLQVGLTNLLKMLTKLYCQKQRQLTYNGTPGMGRRLYFF